MVLSENIFIGKRIDNYRILAEISRSPSSSVYRAEPTLHTKSNVIIKLFHTSQLSEQKRHLFFQETQLLKKIKHVHILPILDVGIYEDTPYLVMENAVGGSLRERINNLQETRLLPIQQTLSMLVQIGQAIQYTHQLNIMHGNLKPENILFREEGDALLADFCVVTLLDTSSSDYTRHPSIYPYMAPERLHGGLYKESDQYALGCIAYELLTGQLPFKADSFSEQQQKNTTEKPIPPTQRNLLLSPSLEETVLKAMEKKIEDRFPSIKDFVERLSIHAAGQSHAFKPAPKALSLTSTSSLHSKSVTIAHSSKNNESVQVKSARDSNPGLIGQTSPARAAPAEQSTQQMVKDRSHADDNSLQKLETVLENTQVLARDNEKLTPPGVDTAQKPLFLDSPLTRSAAFMAETTAKIAAQLSPASSRHIESNGRDASFTQTRFTFIVLWIVIVALVFGLISFGLSLTHPPNSPSKTLVEKTLATTTAGAAQTPESRPGPTVTVASLPASKQAHVVTPTPTPSPTPTPMLIVTPTSFHIKSDCSRDNNHYLCIVTLQLPSNYAGELKWTTSSIGGTTYFNPDSGILSPGQRQQVNVLLPVNCSRAGILFFTTRDGTVKIPWSC